jgi:tetratricopeptide (TPR) repeat protein
MIKTSAFTAAGLVLAASASPSFAQYQNASRAAPPQQQQQAQAEATESAPEQSQGAGVKPSKGALKAIVELQKAVNANDTANIPAKMAAAQAVATTAADKYILAQFQLKIAAAAHDVAGEAAAIDTIAASGLVDNAKMSRLYRGLGGAYYNAKQFDRATTAFDRAIALDPSDLESMKLVANARFAQGQNAEAAAAFQRAIQASTAAGQKADEDLYKRAVQTAYDAKLPAAVDLSRAWAAAYPSPESWRNAVAIYRNLNRQDVEGTLDLLRLMRAAGALTKPTDYMLYATSAADQLNYNEAKAVVDEGIAARQVDPGTAQFRDLIAALKKKPIATSADLATATRDAKTGMALLRIGDRYYALRDYAKAADLYRQAQGKSGVDADVAKLHLGMALAAAGDKAGASTAFKAVGGTRAGIAQLWLAYLQSRA